ncbi:hypothetical protein D3C78_948740 [compost metagenome]
MQLGDLRRAADAEGQWLGALQVDVEIAGEEAAAQLQAYERTDVGLGDTQVDVPGGDLELGADRIERYLAVRFQLAAIAQTGLQFQGEGRRALAVEILQVEVQWTDVQRHGGGGYAIGEVDLVTAQLGVAYQHMPRLRWLDRGRGFDRPCLSDCGVWLAGGYRWCLGRRGCGRRFRYGSFCISSCGRR